MKLNAPIFLSALFLIVSCKDNKDEWLKKYAQTKCAYQTEQEKILADSTLKIPPLSNELKKLHEDFLEFCEPFQIQLSQLQGKISDANDEYAKEYRRITDKQSNTYGHVSTPAYENAIETVRLKKEKNINSFQNKISMIQADMQNNMAYRSLTSKIKNQEMIIQNTQEEIVSAHRQKIDSLQSVLNELNRNFKNILRELDKSEQENLTLRRDSIRTNPCK